MTKDYAYEKTVEYLTENQNRFYRFAFGHVRDKERALDIVQNAVCKALEKYSDIRDIEKINSWFYKVLLNEVYAYTRKHKSEILVSDEELPEQTYTEKAFDKDYLLYDKVNSLSDDFKTIIILRFFEELSLSDIATITKTNINTVKTRLYGALKKLKKAYVEADSDE